MTTRILMLWLVLVSLARSQSTSLAHEDRNQIDPQLLKVSEVKGIAIDPTEVAVPQAQVLLFTSRKHALVAKTKTDAQGKFSFEKARNGVYRLVVKSPGFCPANVPIIVQAGKTGRATVLHITMGGIDTCSYGELR